MPEWIFGTVWVVNLLEVSGTKGVAECDNVDCTAAGMAGWI
jgi:hypothetical protein